MEESVVVSAGRRPTGIGRPWLALCLALALHLAEEAYRGFFPAYGMAIRAVRELFPYVGSPSLALAVSLWMGVALVATLTALTPFAYRGAAWMRVPAIGFSLITLANVTGHVSGSMLAGHALPGVYTAPILAVVGVYGLTAAWRWKPDESGRATA
jgi:hypothetical protein